jgi:hypothetical protein
MRRAVRVFAQWATGFYEITVVQGFAVGSALCTELVASGVLSTKPAIGFFYIGVDAVGSNHHVLLRREIS